MFIQTEETPNPATLKFLPGRAVAETGSVDFASAEYAARSPLADRLFKVEGVERVFLELHDHLYGLDGVMQIIAAMAANGFAFDPRGSSGACALFTRDLTPRAFDDAFALASV